jgi:short-subunit dehydrogenase
MDKGWAVVTGASGGMGAVFVRSLASRGYKVLAVARRSDELARIVEDLRRQGAVVEPMSADLSSADGVEAVAAKAQSLGDVELLVNNAGVSTSGYFLEQSAEKELESIRVNVEALYTLTRRLVPAMVERKRGGILNIASIVAIQPVPYWTTYAATKAFVLSFGEGLAHELRGRGVRVVTVCPGFTRTGLYTHSGVPGLAGRILPHAMPEQVVSAALAAYDAGAVVRVIGPVNRFLALASGLSPRFMIRWIMGTLFRPRAA